MNQFFYENEREANLQEEMLQYKLDKIQSKQRNGGRPRKTFLEEIIKIEMKYLISLALLLFANNCLFAQPVSELRTIDVTGSAELQVKPDFARMTIDISTLDKDLQNAKKQNQQILENVSAIAKRFMVNGVDLNADQVNFEKQYVYVKTTNRDEVNSDGEPARKREFLGYEVSSPVVIKFRDIAKFSEFVEALLTTGISGIDSISYEVNDTRPFRDKVRLMAMQASQEKAQAMVNAVGQKLGKAVSIVEEGFNNPNYSYANSGVLSNSIGTAPGTVTSEDFGTYTVRTITINASVKVKYLID